MNIRKNIDYSGLYAGLDEALTAGLSQMELYLELGRLVSGRPEKGAAVMAAEYITANYPDRIGFSPRNLRRMRDFYRMYEGQPGILAQAMKIGWTQNIVIMEADLDMDARCWYLQAVRQFGWPKVELSNQIAVGVHLGKSLVPCYIDKNNFVQDMVEDSKSIIFQQVKYPSEPNQQNNCRGTGNGYQSKRTDRVCYGRQGLREIGRLFLLQIIRIRGPSFFEVT